MNILQLDANNFNQDLTISIKEDEKNVKIDYKQGTGCVVSLSNENREQGTGNREQGPGTREQGTGCVVSLSNENREQKYYPLPITHYPLPITHLG